jgi:hypothetical protein
MCYSAHINHLVASSEARHLHYRRRITEDSVASRTHGITRIIGNWLVGHLTISVLEALQGDDLILGYRLRNEGVHPIYGLRYSSGIYVSISWPAEFIPGRIPKGE